MEQVDSESSAPDLIPTRFKAKIAHDWSYPIGAEVLSNALAEIPQYALINLDFHSPHIKKGENTIPLIWVNYSNPRTTAMERNWSITVYSVPSSLRSEFRKRLIGEVLPCLRRWITAKRTPVWLGGNKGLHVVFNKETEKIQYEEATWG